MCDASFLISIIIYSSLMISSVHVNRLLESGTHTVKNGVSSKHQGVKFLCVMQTPKCSHNTPMSR